MKTSEIQDLIAQATQAREQAYSPYYKIYVGAALLAKDGSVFRGCNVENIAGSAIACAESNALGSAVVAGQKNFQAIAIVGSDTHLFFPCGNCLQKLAEFESDLDIYVASTRGTYEHHKLRDLLPHPPRAR